MIIFRFVKLSKGNTLIEALLALGFAVVIITAVVTVVITALNGSIFTKNQNLATQYAQEGLDIARYMKTSNYTAFQALTSGVDYCATQNGTLVRGECVKAVFFKTKIIIDHNGGIDPSGGKICGGGSSFVNSIVTWTDSKCTGGAYCHSIQLDTCLADLQLSNPF